MATGQNSFTFTNYGEVAVVDNLTGGIQLYGNGYASPSYESLPVSITKVTGISPAQVIGTKWGSVTVNSLVEVYPMGLALPAKPKRYICDATEATLAALRT